MPDVTITSETLTASQAGGKPAPVKKDVGLVGLFEDPDQLIAMAETVRDAGYSKWDCHTPFPVHGLDDAMGLKPSPMPYICLGAGAVGAGAAMLMQWWMSAVDYPVRIGGKPLFSWPAFIPITFELFVLFAALATMGGMLKLCKLGKWHSPLHDTGVMHLISSRMHAVVLDREDEKFDEDAARKMFADAGCKDVRTLYEIFEEED